MDPLFNPFRFKCGSETKNRIVLAPMTNKQSPTGSLSTDELQWLSLRAKGGFGMILTCAASVLKSGRAWEGQLAIESDDHEKALMPLADICRNEKCLGLVQLHHGGVTSPFSLTSAQPISAGSLYVEGVHNEKPRAATNEEIEEIVHAFERAAQRVERAGLDGIEIHGANGYLITQFLSSFFNTRTDDWGGSREKRGRLLFEIVRACRKILGPTKILGVRLSPISRPSFPGIEVDDILWTAQELCKFGVDYVHLSLWDCFEIPNGLEQTLTELYRKNLPSSVALIGAGGIFSRESAHKYFELGGDFVALAKVAVGNPNWPNSMHSNPNYEPESYPMSTDKLKARGVSPAFINYLKEFKRTRYVE